MEKLEQSGADLENKREMLGEHEDVLPLFDPSILASLEPTPF